MWTSTFSLLPFYSRRGTDWGGRIGPLGRICGAGSHLLAELSLKREEDIESEQINYELQIGLLGGRILSNPDWCVIKYHLLKYISHNSASAGVFSVKDRHLSPTVLIGYTYKEEKTSTYPRRALSYRAYTQTSFHQPLHLRKWPPRKRAVENPFWQWSLARRH